MDRRSFEKAVQRARRWRERIEASFKTEAEMYAKLGRNAAEEAAIRPGQFPYWIQQSEGNRNIWDGLNLIAQETLRSRKPLPDALASWVADVLAEERPRPKLRGSRRPGQLSSGGPNFLQNHLIVTAIDILATKGYSPPERNRSRGPRCCLQAVPYVMRSASLSMCSATRRSRGFGGNTRTARRLLGGWSDGRARSAAFQEDADGSRLP